MTDLKKKGTVKKRSPLYTLSPQIGEDGLIRLRSRFQNARRSYAARNPVILPKKHFLVDALVHKYHKEFFHQGQASVVTALREKVWIIHAKSVVWRIKKECNLCTWLTANPSKPRMGDLPKFRLDDGQKPFTHVGVDACGHFDVAY